MIGRPKSERIVEARMKLRERFLGKLEATPALSDSEPMGTGPDNRHGMPQLPPDQYRTTKWPVLDLGIKPSVPTSEWRLSIEGSCRAPFELDWAEFMNFEQVEDTSDFHCVTTWSRMDIAWRGVRLADLIALADPLPSAQHLMCYGYDAYEVNVPLVEAIKPDVLVVHTADGAPLPLDHGGPARIITPQLYAWKGAKWIHRIELLETERLGFWEQRGYSSTAHPWRNDRYS